jgi:hypothetical protein
LLVPGAVRGTTSCTGGRLGRILGHQGPPATDVRSGRFGLGLAQIEENEMFRHARMIAACTAAALLAGGTCGSADSAHAAGLPGHTPPYSGVRQILQRLTTADGVPGRWPT